MFDLDAVQAAIRDNGLDGWLLYDFRGSNVLARRVLGFAEGTMSSRRWFYFVPAQGIPRKLVHRIEPAALDHVPGGATVYLKWQELEAGVGSLLAGSRRVAMEYSPRNGNPYIGRVDAGTVEVVRSFGVDVVSSGDLIQRFEATWDDEQAAMHFEAERGTTSAYEVAWRMIADRARAGNPATETEVQRAIMDHFRSRGLTTYHPPIVGVGPHGGDPHFETCEATDVPIAPDSFVLIDLWAKCDRPRSVYSDLTRVGYVGTEVPAKYAEVFAVVAAARDAAVEAVRSAFAEGRPIRGFEVDDACRAVIEAAGYGAYFIHRTGHSIGQEVHGNGANMDGLETRDDRLILPGTCFSVEPGIYQAEFGVRSEINVFVDRKRAVHVTGGLQREVVPILRDY